MGVLKKIKIELILFALLTLVILTSSSFDVSINSFFLKYTTNNNHTYLKEFFVNITQLGDSLWYFGTTLVFLFFFLIIKKTKLLNIKNLERKIHFFISSIFYLIAIGLITQIIKHIIGRPRPNYAELEAGLNFNFFTLESNFHSFPSGHSSTIFMVCFILSAVLPKLRYYFFCLASVVAISRVVVGAHFITDVIAGGLLSLIVFKFLNFFLKTNLNKYLFYKIDFVKNEQLYNYTIILLGLILFLTVSPAFDLYVSSLFYISESQFILQSFHLTSLVFRKILIPIILIYLLVLPLISKYLKVNKLFFGYNFSINEILLIWFSQIVSLLIVVNLLLKNYWGRARPNDIVEFGGNELFTPWYKISEGCLSNCSFVSGDASVGFGMIILYFITKKAFFLKISMLCGLSLGIIRIIAGGHFMSDILFAAIFVSLSNVIIYQCYKKYYVK